MPVLKESENPDSAFMNNFYMHMPGGYYRGDKSFQPDSIPAVGIRVLMNQFEEYLRLPAEDWPQEHVENIQLLKRILEIQNAIDEVLEKKSES